MRIFTMECLKMCVVVGLALTAAPGRPVAAASSPTNAYVYQQHKRSPVDPNLDLTSGLTTDFGGFGPSSTLPDFGYSSGFPSTAAGFGFDDATAGFGTSTGLLHLSHPYTSAAFGSGFGSIGYPFSESTLSQLQFKSTLASGSSPSLPVPIKYSPSVANVGLHHTHITGLLATEPAKLTAQKTVSLQQTRPNEQRVQAESIKATPAPLQQLYSTYTSTVPQQQTYAIYAPLKQSYPTSASVPQQQSYVTAISAPLQQSYPPPTYVPQQQLYQGAIPVPLQQSYNIATPSASFQQLYVTSESVPQQQSYSSSGSVPQQQAYSSSGSVPQQQSYSSSGSVPQQQSYSSSESVPQQQSYSSSGSVQQQQSYSPSGSVPQKQSYSLSGRVPQQQSYPVVESVQQQQSYSSSGSTSLQQSYPAADSVQQQQPYQTTLTEPLQQAYVAATPTQLQQSYPATSGDFRNSAYQPPAAGSAPDLILELRPPPYTMPASSVDYRQNVNIPSTPPSSYQPADSNNNNKNYPGNDFGLTTSPVASTSGLNQVSNAPNGGSLPENTNNFLTINSNAKPDQIPSNTYYTVPVPVSGGSNSVSSDVSNYFSIPSIAYSLTSTVNSGFAGSTSAPPAAPVSSIGTDRGVPAADNPTGGPSPSYREANSIPSVSYLSSNSIPANSYSDSNSIQSSTYTIPSSPVAGNSYSDYKLNAENVYVDTNSISPNSKRESSTVNSSEKFPRVG